MPRPPQNRNNSSVLTIESLPHDLLTEVLVRVANSSIVDMLNAKLSCKILNNIAEDSLVYQNASLEKFPIVLWKPLPQNQEAFLKKCRGCKNTELLYREAVIDYFNRANILSAAMNLDKALKVGHIGALYVKCIILILTGDKKLMQRGIELMGTIRGSKSTKGNIKSCRDKLSRVLEEIWVKNPILKQKPVCCTKRHQWQKRSHWPNDDEDNVICQACCAEKELGFICSRYYYG